MKTVAAALVIVVACFVMVRGQEKKSVESPPLEWALSLNTGGAPWEKKFQVDLNHGLIGGSIGALYPALRAARQDAVDALSYE